MSKSVEVVRSGKLLQVEASRQEVRLDFGKVVVGLLAYVEIIAPDGGSNTIEDVWECKGNLNALWLLIGRHMTKIVMDEDSFRLTFEDGTLIRCKNRKDFDFVKVWEPEYETGYPTVIHYLSQA
jgi:hypothetical protein